MVESIQGHNQSLKNERIDSEARDSSTVHMAVEWFTLRSTSIRLYVACYILQPISWTRIPYVTLQFALPTRFCPGCV